MKNWLPLLILLAFTACSKNKSEAPAKDAETSTATKESSENPETAAPETAKDASPGDAAATGRAAPVLTIAPEDTVCESNADCTIVLTQCSCHCGESVNKKHEQRYSDLLTKECADYKGILCRMKCSNHSECRNNRCVTLPGRLPPN